MTERRAPRLYVTDRLAPAGEVELDAGQQHYLRSVLRLGLGAAVAAFNPEDGEWLCRIAGIGKNGVRLTAERQLRSPELGGEADLWLVFAPIKRARVDWLVEKATELGVSALLPVWKEVMRFADSDQIKSMITRATTGEAQQSVEVKPAVPSAASAQQVPVAPAPRPAHRPRTDG